MPRAAIRWQMWKRLRNERARQRARQLERARLFALATPADGARWIEQARKGVEAFRRER